MLAQKHEYCRGYQDEVRTFGANGRRAQPHGPSQCLFCDIDRLNASFLDGTLALATKKRFAKLTLEAREKALARVRRPGYRAWLGRVQQVQAMQPNQAEDAAVLPPASPNAWKQTLPFTDAELRAMLKALGYQRCKRGALKKGLWVKGVQFVKSQNKFQKLWNSSRFVCNWQAPMWSKPNHPRGISTASGDGSQKSLDYVEAGDRPPPSFP